MTNRPFRFYDHARDFDAVKRIWRETGWVEGEENEYAGMDAFFQLGETEIATINDEAECAVHWTPGEVQYQEDVLPMGAVTAVTTSHIARKQGFAKELTARSLARQADRGMAVSTLGMFEQGFYNRVGYGSGPYEVLIQFDPTTLNVDHPFRPPTRLTRDNYEDVHQALLNRKRHHGAASLTPSGVTKAELLFTENPFGLGYFDGPGNSLSHFIWGGMKDEHGPYSIEIRAYRTNEQLSELLALIKSLGDQINSFTTLEWGEFQFQDIINQPFRNRRVSKGGKHEQLRQAIAYWQIRILDLDACLAKTHLVGEPVRFNLDLTDPVNEILTGETGWSGIAGDYVITLGEESSAKPGSDKQIPTLKASVNAFSRMWFGIRPATNLAITDNLTGDESLLNDLDRILRLPKPHFGWDF